MSVHRLNVCVFCGSNAGSSPLILGEAEKLAQGISKMNLGLVYGGASVGLMGAIADTVLKKGGYVTGVIPNALFEKEVAHKGVQDLRIVETMHERKKLMYDLSEFFIALPGGFGTLDELFEVLTWSQIGVHSKKIYLLNSDGFYDGLLSHLDSAVSAGFIKSEHRSYLRVFREPAALLAEIADLVGRKSLID